MQKGLTETMESKNLLIELGTEELPPKSLRKLAESLHDNFVGQLKNAGLNHKETKWYATPRRLALYIKDLDVKQEDKVLEIKGPSVKAAYNADGTPSKAALGWAAANHVSISETKTLKTEKGEWLLINKEVVGLDTKDLVPDLFVKALKALPIPRLMHWGAKKEEFVRPVHTLCILFGDQLIDGEVLGIQSNRTINGHRFLGNQQVTIKNADSYIEQLRTEGNVVADYEERKQSIISQVKKIADSVNGNADLDDSLVEEVTSIVEAPYIFKANFEESFLNVPSEALVYTMKGDQKYFPIYDQNGKLLPCFAFVSNINPQDPSQLIEGNERVVRPRLSDAQFFFNQDRKHSLEYFYEKLENIVYQKDIGTIAYRSTIVENVASYIAQKIGADSALAKRAAHLAKCDLASTVVTEFPDIQGIIGMHYAELDGENKDVSEAIFQSYQPRFAGDSIPNKPVQIAVSLAEKLVTLVGIFGINMLPKGDKDPFGLRRAAIGFIRILIENGINLDFTDAVKHTAEALSAKLKNANTCDNVVDFIYNRLKGYYQDKGIDAPIFLSVLSCKPNNLLDFDKRINAVESFKVQPAAEDLASAYKRISNILNKAEFKEKEIDDSLLIDEAEIALARIIKQVTPEINKFFQEGNYADALSKLSDLKESVDNFFEHVMVNDKDEKIKENRLNILAKLKYLFSKTADISVLY